MPRTKVEAKEEVKIDMDPGDKISASLSFKKNLGNYQSMDFFAGATVTQRDSETTDEAWQRAWKLVEDELEDEVEKANGILNKASK